MPQFAVLLLDTESTPLNAGAAVQIPVVVASTQIERSVSHSPSALILLIL